MCARPICVQICVQGECAVTKISISNTRKPGSTIDDSDRLAKIASLLASQPTLSLSDAIKSIGITDRASLRRLRGKYNRSSTSNGVIATRESGSRSSGSRSSASNTMGKNRQAAMALRASGTAKTKRSPNHSKSVSQPSTNGTAVPSDKNQATSAAASADPGDSQSQTNKSTASSSRVSPFGPVSPYGMTMPPWLRIGMDLSAVAMHTQVQFYQQMMRMGPMTNLVKQQADMFKAMSGSYPKRTKRKAA